MAGDPRADVARTVSILRLAHESIKMVDVGTWVLETGWRRGYEEVAGPLGDMSPFYGWAGAVMVRVLSFRSAE